MKRITGTALVLVLAFTLAASSPQQQTTRVLRGTLYAIQAEAGTCDVLTGVGMALRVVNITTPPTTRAVTGGKEIPLSSLKRGDILRVECHWSGNVLIADRIERVVLR